MCFSGPSRARSCGPVTGLGLRCKYSYVLYLIYVFGQKNRKYFGGSKEKYGRVVRHICMYSATNNNNHISNGAGAAENPTLTWAEDPPQGVILRVISKKKNPIPRTPHPAESTLAGCDSSGPVQMCCRSSVPRPV